MKNTDIIIIGAGMAGLTSAIYLKRANANFVILEGLLPGGLLNSLKVVENYPGYQKTSGKDILLNLMEQVKDLGISLTYGSVQTILKEPEGFKVVTDKDSYLAKAVIVASGYANKGEPIKGELEYKGMGVSYCATCDGNFFKGSDVCVFGNNNSALEEALYLANLVKKLYFVVNGDSLEGDENLVSSLKGKSNVEIIYDSIQEIKGDMLGVSSVELESGKSISVSGVFPYVSKKSTGEFLANLKPIDEGGFLLTNEEMNCLDYEGLYAAGDIRMKSVKQLVTAANDGAIAALSANKFIKSHK